MCYKNNTQRQSNHERATDSSTPQNSSLSCSVCQISPHLSWELVGRDVLWDGRVLSLSCGDYLIITLNRGATDVSARGMVRRPPRWQNCKCTPPSEGRARSKSLGRGVDRALFPELSVAFLYTIIMLRITSWSWPTLYKQNFTGKSAKQKLKTCESSDIPFSPSVLS